MRLFLLALMCCCGINAKFVLLDKWKDAYQPLYQNVNSGDFTFDPLAAQDSEFELAVHTVVNHSFTDQGWDYVYFRPSAALSLVDSFAAVGYAEGFRTRQNITQQLVSVPKVSAEVSAWISNQTSYLLRNIGDKEKKHPSVESFWHRVDCLLQQIHGMVRGYNDALAMDQSDTSAVLANNITFDDLYMLNYMNEFQDVEFAVQGGEAAARNSRPGATMFIKYTDYDFFMGHNTIAPYSTMRRQYKSYCMDTTLSFSGYPGKIGSGDDWILTNAELVIQSAPLYVFNQELYKTGTVSTSAPQFLRVLIASYIATSGSSWCKFMEMDNSGTGNAQYNVVLMNRFHAGKLKRGLFYQLEQIPGATAFAELTSNLTEKGHWISVDVPVFTTNISEPAGYPEQQKKEGIWGPTELTNPRYRILEQAAHDISQKMGGVFSMDTMQAVMRHNSYSLNVNATIPDCEGAGEECHRIHSAMLSVAARGDLNIVGDASVYGPAVNWIGRVDRGATDSKIVSRSTLHNALDGLVMAGIVISGPTDVVNDELAPFDWGPFLDEKPSDLPKVYNFTWLRYAVPYPPHGYYDGYPSIVSVVGVMVGTVFVASILGAVMVRMALGKRDETDDPFSENASLLKNSRQQ